VAAVLGLCVLGLPRASAAGPLFQVGGQVSAPAAFNLSGGVLFPIVADARIDQSPASDMKTGVLLSGALGTGAHQVGAGFAVAATEGSPLLTYGIDARATYTRTHDHPTHADPLADYAGVDAGLTLAVVHVRAGYAHRLHAPPGAAHVNALTWSVGVQFSFGWSFTE
jgi:hypothetical protein